MFNNPADIKLSNVHYEVNKKLQEYIKTLPDYVQQNEEIISDLTPMILDSKALADFKEFISLVYSLAGGRFTIQSIRAGFFIKDRTHSFAVISKGLVEKDLKVIYTLFKKRFDSNLMDSVYDRQKKAIKVLDKEIRYWKRPLERALFSPVKVYDSKKKLCYGWEVDEVIPVFKPKI